MKKGAGVRDGGTNIKLSDDVLDVDPADFDTYMLEHPSVGDTANRLGEESVWIISLVAGMATFFVLVAVTAIRRRSLQQHLPATNEGV